MCSTTGIFFQKVFNNYTLIKKTLKNNKYKHADLLYMFQSVENLSLIHVSSSPYIPRGQLRRKTYRKCELLLENQAHPLYCSINLFYTIPACFDFSGGFTLSIEVNILAAHGWFMVACFWDEILLVIGSLRHEKTLNFIQKYFDFPSQCGQSFQRWP